MDARRFDGFARVWWRRMGRRDAVRSVAALLLAGSSVEHAHAPAAAQAGYSDVCARDADCRANVPDRCVHAHCRSGQCAYAAIRCAAGYHCCGNGRCCADEAAAPACLADADCGTSDPCVVSRCDGGLCVSLVVDCAPGHVCCGSAGCCPGP